MPSAPSVASGGDGRRPRQLVPGADIQAALDEQIEVLQEQQQAASQTLDELRATSGEMQVYLQAHFKSAWNEIVTSYKAAALLVILDAMCTGCISA